MVDKETQFFQKRMEDLAARADRDLYPVSTEFLTEHERLLLLAMQPDLPVSVFYDGGHQDAERVVAVFVPEGLSAQADIVCLKIELIGAGLAGGLPEHRDYLGALMALGFEREKLGDIIVNGARAFLFAKEDMAGFIVKNLAEVGAYKVNAAPCQWDEAFSGVSKKELVISLSSLRLDSVVSRSFNLSRGDGALAVKQGKIFIDGVMAEKIDRQMKMGESVSFRGKGKIRLIEQVGRSKSDRLQIKIEKYGCR